MKKFICILMTTFVGITAVFAQTVTLTFTGRDANNHFIPFDRVEIGNVTRSWQETIYYPDTVIVMGGTGIEENVFTKGFALAQNNPNPFEVTTNATLTTSEAGEVTMEMLDMNGRMVASQKFGNIQAGVHQFTLTVAVPGTYILTARQNGKTSSIKMVNKGEGAMNRVEYVGLSGTKAEIPEQKSESKGIITNPFTLGNEMMYIGYVNISGTEYTSQTIHKNQIVSENFVLNFNATAPAGMATVTTDEVTNIQPTRATCGGNVVDDGGYSVIARGICWNTTPNPVFNENHISSGDGLGAFTCYLTNLSENTTYYVRAYAVNSVDTAYGQQRIFTTSVTLPTITTNNVSCITATTATCGGNVTNMGGAPVTSRGVCWNTSQNPTVSDSHTTDGSGMGDFTSNMTGLIFGTTYYVRAYATNSGRTAYGEQRCFTQNIDGQPCLGTPTVTDHEDNVYATVQIGNQCWMRDNLRTTTSPSTGTYLIPAVGTDYTYTGKQARWYNNDSTTYALMNYGLLYNWNAAVDTFKTAYGETSVNISSSNAVSVNFTGHRRGICPAGWHLPSNAEWTQLTDHVSSQCQYLCEGNTSYIAKALADSIGWDNYYYVNCFVGNNQSTNNATGFSALPAGHFISSSYNAGIQATFWSSAQSSNNNAYYRYLRYSTNNIDGATCTKSIGCSVRCLRDY